MHHIAYNHFTSVSAGEDHCAQWEKVQLLHKDMGWASTSVVDSNRKAQDHIRETEKSRNLIGATARITMQKRQCADPETVMRLSSTGDE